MKNKKTLIIIISGLIVVITVLLYIFVFQNRNNNVTGENEYKPGTVKEQKLLQPCKDTSDCMFGERYIYAHLKFDTGIAQIDDVVKKINEKEDELYTLTVNSTLDNDDCKNVKSNLNFSHYYGAEYYTYESDKYVSIGVTYTSLDLCLNKYTGKQATAYIYDKTSKKMLTQEEFKNKIKLSDEAIYELIKNNLEFLNNNGSNYKIQDKYKDVVVFFSEDGNLYISFYQSDIDNYLITYASI